MSQRLYNTDSYELLTLQCSKVAPETTSQQLYHPYSNVVPMNSYSPHLDLYSNGGGHSYHRAQVSTNASYGMEQQSDMNWDTRLMSDMKITEKIDLVEITSKDLSPASYCSNIDLLIPDYYKNGGKDINMCNKIENHWLPNTNFNSQRNSDYPSCAQVARNETHVEKPARYCSIQKDFEAPVKQGDLFVENNVSFNKNHNLLRNNELQSQYCSYASYQTKDENPIGFDSVIDQLYNQAQPISDVPFPLINVEQQSEVSNEESDIIVEESDEDITDDVSEDHERRFYNQVNKCVICNLLYTPLGTQFYFLTAESPLTMSSQKPVYHKIIDIVGSLVSEHHYLCNQCLGLINTIDHLQCKLQDFYKELQMKFKKSCIDNTNSNSVICSAGVKIKKSLNNGRRIPKFRCKACKCVLSFQTFLASHLQKHKKRFLCELCGKLFNSYKRFKVHSNNHKIKKMVKIDPFKCSNCPKFFRTKSNLKEHENFCLGILPFKCKVHGCDKKFPSVSKLKSHVKLKHDKKFIAICSICNIGFVSVNHYKSHKISHSTDKKYSCNKCDKTYKTVSNLNFHMKVHQEKLPFICQVCSKGFMRKEYLEAHVNNHKGIKNFSCALCEKKFVSQKNLDSHLKYHDGSVKKKTCNICGKSMTTGYEEHLRIHSNLLEYECDKCDRKFNTKGTLSKHRKQKHMAPKPT